MVRDLLAERRDSLDCIPWRSAIMSLNWTVNASALKALIQSQSRWSPLSVSRSKVSRICMSYLIGSRSKPEVFARTDIRQILHTEPQHVIQWIAKLSLNPTGLLDSMLSFFAIQ